MVYYRRRRGGYRRRRPSYRRRFKRGPGYYRRGRRFRGRRGVPSMPRKVSVFRGWPEIMYCKHLWTDTYTYSYQNAATGEPLWGNAIRCNAVADPWVGFDLANYPTRYATMSALYDKCTVVGCKATATITNPQGPFMPTSGAGVGLSAPVSEYIIAWRTNDDNGTLQTGALTTDQIQCSSDPKMHWKRTQLVTRGVIAADAVQPVTTYGVIPAGTKTSATVTMTWSLKRDCGVVDASNPDWVATGNGGQPAQQRAFILGLGYLDRSLPGRPGYTITWRVQYTCRWEKLKDLTYVNQ